VLRAHVPARHGLALWGRPGPVSGHVRTGDGLPARVEREGALVGGGRGGGLGFSRGYSSSFLIPLRLFRPDRGFLVSFWVGARRTPESMLLTRGWTAGSTFHLLERERGEEASGRWLRKDEI